jgi:hypothetical protein
MKDFVASKTIMVRLPYYSTYWPIKKNKNVMASTIFICRGILLKYMNENTSIKIATPLNKFKT